MPSTDSVNRSRIVRNSVDLVDEDSRTEIVDSESEILKSTTETDARALRNTNSTTLFGVGASSFQSASMQGGDPSS